MIYLMRHGQDQEEFIGGWSNVSLTVEGIKQVNESAKWIKKNLNIKKMIVSDINRVIETSNIVSAIIGVDYESTSKLREQNKGLLNGMDRELADTKYPITEEITVDFVYPEGESLRDLYNRICKYIDEILKMDDDTLIITHRGVINMIYYYLNDIELDMEKSRFNVEVASIHELDKENKTIKRVW